MTGAELLQSYYVPVVAKRLEAIDALQDSQVARFITAHNQTEQIIELSALSNNQPFMHVTKIANSRLKTCLRQLLTYDYIAANHSLRSVLELHLGGIQFSVDEFKYREWKSEKRDINWNAMVDNETGVFSKNFAYAFYPDLADQLSTVRNVACSLFSQCSKYVHCNPSATTDEILSQEFSEVEFFRVIEKVSTLRTITFFGFLMRFSDSIPRENLLKIEDAVLEVFGDTAEIRKLYE